MHHHRRAAKYGNIYVYDTLEYRHENVFEGISFTEASRHPSKNPKTRPNTAIITVFCKPVRILFIVPGLVNLFQKISKLLIDIIYLRWKLLKSTVVYRE